MSNSLATRAARACAAATLVFSLGLAPAYARMGGAGGVASARPAFGFAHPHFAAHAFNRFDAGRSGFHRFGTNRFNRFGGFRFHRFGFNRFNRFGNQLFIGGLGCCGWGGWGGVPVSTEASEPVVVGGGAPVIINISADPKPADAGSRSGGCVTHKLIYDGDGKYAGERERSQC